MVQMELAMKKKERNDKVYEKGIIKGRKHCYCFLTRRYLRFIFPLPVSEVCYRRGVEGNFAFSVESFHRRSAGLWWT